MEVVRLKHLFDPDIESLDPLPGRRLRAIAERDAVRLGMLRRCQTVLYAQFGTELVELVLAGGAAFAQAERAVGKFLPVIGQDRPDPDWAGPFQIAQKAAGIGGGLGFKDPDEHPAGRPINRHEQAAARGFISHLRQILDVHMQVAWFVGLECLVLRPGVFRLQIAQITNPVPTQAAVET